MSEVDEFASHLDQLAVEMHLVEESPDDVPYEVWYVESVPSTENASRSRVEVEWELLNQFYEHFLDPASDHLPPYELKEQYTRFEWGASGAGATITLVVALGLLHAGMNAVAADAWTAFREWYKQRSHVPAGVDREGAEAHARWRVESTYKVDLDSLELLAEEESTNDNTWTFRFAGPDDELFTVELDAEGSGLVTGKLSREVT